MTTRIFFDTEFIENGETILPLSVGMVDEHDNGLYIVLTDTDREEASPWVIEHVIPHLDCEPPGAITRRLQRAEAGDLVRHFVARCTPNSKPEFWADYCSYDWVLLCQLFGTMMDLPHGWPMFCNDIQQDARRLGSPKLPEGDDDHNAFTDAVTTRDRWTHLRTLGDM